MKVLITGALGFIGSHLAETFLRMRHEVIGLDDRSGNVVDAIPGMRCYTLDARQVDQIALGDVPDLIVHAASPVGAVALLERRSIVAEIIESTQAILRFCEATRTPLINISSSEVYGTSGVYRESDECVVPCELTHRLQYAAGKLAAEQLVRTADIAALTIRPFNVAGPRQARAKGFVIPTFVEQAHAGQPLTVFDGGQQERCPTGVWDLCDFIAAAALSTIAQGAGGPRWARAWRASAVLNVGAAANRTTVNELAELVLDVTGSSSPIVHTSGKAIHGPAYEEARGRVKVPDATAALALGWQPQVGLREMVERTLAEITHSGGTR